MRTVYKFHFIIIRIIEFESTILIITIASVLPIVAFFLIEFVIIESIIFMICFILYFKFGIILKENIKFIIKNI